MGEVISSSAAAPSESALIATALCVLSLGFYALVTGSGENNNDDDDSHPGGGLMQPVA